MRIAMRLFMVASVLASAAALRAQDAGALAEPAAVSVPIAIVPLDTQYPDVVAKVTGALEVTQGRAIIAASGTITSGSATTQVVLPHRGVMRVCASTTVKLAADASVPAGETPGLMMAMDQGAVELSFATGRNSDMLLTPDFRILIGGPGAADVKVRLGQHGDTCVDNAGVDAPYVLVSSVFDGGAYRVQAGQRVMFEHGSLHDVVDQEKEPCGCPPAAPASPQGNEFPLAQSEGLTPLAAPTPAPANPQTLPTEPLSYSSADHAAKPAADASAAVPAAASAPANPQVATPNALQKKPGLFGKIGSFFRRIFGAD
jgi:hypothetical protein